MTREEQIKEVAKKTTGLFSYRNGYLTAEDAFIAGANWADKNPKSPWISVEERLPEIEYPSIGESDFVFVHVVNKDTGNEWIELSAKYNERFHDWMTIDFTWIKMRGGVVTHWMPIPELPKEERK